MKMGTPYFLIMSKNKMVDDSCLSISLARKNISQSLDYMKLEDCKNCTYHSGYVQGQILCRYWGTNINSVATYQDRNGIIYAVGCPKEK